MASLLGKDGARERVITIGRGRAGGGKGVSRRGTVSARCGMSISTLMPVATRVSRRLISPLA